MLIRRIVGRLLASLFLCCLVVVLAGAYTASAAGSAKSTAIPSPTRVQYDPSVADAVIDASSATDTPVVACCNTVSGIKTAAAETAAVVPTDVPKEESPTDVPTKVVFTVTPIAPAPDVVTNTPGKLGASPTLVPTSTLGATLRTSTPVGPVAVDDTPTETPVPTNTAVPTATVTPTPACGTVAQPCVTVLMLPTIDEVGGGSMMGVLIFFCLLFPFVRQSVRFVLALGLIFSLFSFVLSGMFGYLYGFVLLCVMLIPVHRLIVRFGGHE